MSKPQKTLFCFLFLFYTAYCLDINILADKNLNNIPIGVNGTFGLLTDYNDAETKIFNPSDMENLTSKETILKTSINSQEYKITCRLWKNSTNYVFLLCKLNEGSLVVGNQIITINGYSINYNGNTINIIFDQKLGIQQLERTIPFIYSEDQTIKIEKDKDFCEFKFKLGEYHNELLIIEEKSGANLILMDQCAIEGKELKCKVPKEEILAKVEYNDQKFYLSFSNDLYDKKAF